MAKKNIINKKEEETDFFDFSDMAYDDAYDEDTLVDVMGEILEASNNQMKMALELTKLIVANSPVDKMEEHVFSVFKKASKVVGENFALKSIMEQMER